MGTYTTNLELYMPTVGETGWGNLMNENLEKIDESIHSMSTLPKILITVTPLDTSIPSNYPSGGVYGNDDNCYDSFHLLTYYPHATYTGTVCLWCSTSSANYYKIHFVLEDGSVSSSNIPTSSSTQIQIPTGTVYAMVCFGTDNNYLSSKVVTVKAMSFSAQYVT